LAKIVFLNIYKNKLYFIFFSFGLQKNVFKIIYPPPPVSFDAVLDPGSGWMKIRIRNG
jgi:hypothetical protein